MKVYLSKSKSGNPDILMKVRHLLKDFDIEIKEYTGGNYYDNIIDDCDAIIIVPPELPKSYIYSFNIGKGQYSEAQRGKQKKIPVFPIVILGDDVIYVSKSAYLKQLDQDWALNYGSVYYNENTIIHLNCLPPFDALLKKNSIEEIDTTEPYLVLYKG